MTRNFPNLPYLGPRPLLLLLLCALPLACRSSGDFRARTLPDPVPTHQESGRAWFFVEIQSLSRHEVRLGAAGPVLVPGGRLVVEADLAAGDEAIHLDLQEVATGRHTHITVPVRTIQGTALADLDYPIPDLGGHEVRITAGFHAPNHRRPGRRLALDLVPVLPEGRSALGTEIRVPFRALVVAFTEEEPDLPGFVPNEVLLRDEQGRIWRYAHFQQGSIPLRIDRWIDQGALLGRIGLSGKTTGPHLHIELLTPPDR